MSILKKGNLILGFMIIGFLFFSSFTSNHKKENLEHKDFVLTVHSEDDSQTLLFDLLITGKNLSGEDVLKTEKSKETPFKLELESGDYITVVKRISNEGQTIVTMTNITDNTTCRSTITPLSEIALLTIDKKGNCFTTGM